jgi:hypothetical protein
LTCDLAQNCATATAIARVDIDVATPDAGSGNVGIDLIAGASQIDSRAMSVLMRNRLVWMKSRANRIVARDFITPGSRGDAYLEGS